MMNRFIFSVFLLLLFWGAGGISFSQRPDFNDWRFESQRPEIAPMHWVDQRHTVANSPTLALAGAGKAYANGYWLTTGEVEANTFYEFSTQFQCDRVDQISRSILARLL
ncbi:MAG: hypothetical protein EHM72_16980, partial [Calditrichaeota bacterium]